MLFVCSSFLVYLPQSCLLRQQIVEVQLTPVVYIFPGQGIEICSQASLWLQRHLSFALRATECRWYNEEEQYILKYIGTFYKNDPYKQMSLSSYFNIQPEINSAFLYQKICTQNISLYKTTRHRTESGNIRVRLQNGVIPRARCSVDRATSMALGSTGVGLAGWALPQLLLTSQSLFRCHKCVQCFAKMCIIFC